MPATQAAADSCLSAPKGATPSGSHWYYRIDRVTKRQCWYLREESDTADDKFARAAPPASAPASSSAAAEPAPPQQRTITRKSIADARAEWISQQPRAEPNSPARVEPRTVAAAPAPAVQNSPRAAMPNVLAPAPLSSMRWNDAPVMRASANPTDLQLAAANPPAVQPPQAAEVQQFADCGRSGCAHRCGGGAGKADRIAAEAASGDGRRPRAGRPHGKRDRPDRPHAGAPRHAPQAARDVGFRKDRKDKAAFAATDVPRRGRRAAAHRRRAQSARAPGPDTRAPGADHACPKSGRAYLKRKSGRRAFHRSGHARPRNGDTCPRIACPRIGSGSCRLRKCWPGSPAARRPDRNGSGGYFSSWRCSLRTNSVRPVRRSRLSRSALRIDCTSANASSTLWLTTI